jgi:hypothetical protein
MHGRRFITATNKMDFILDDNAQVKVNRNESLSGEINTMATFRSEMMSIKHGSQFDESHKILLSSMDYYLKGLIAWEAGDRSEAVILFRESNTLQRLFTDSYAIICGEDVTKDSTGVDNS